jgi:UDP-N-acetylglucosamine diphosphorylase / glucose-1-phosphate thymidylyltransferase / UDP-N-acetylgalactosamine diphosphorylase / glucosamine-1-phosphate N-acetyltransferase / galactosamine-1-phosphate N-acetyltransferase
MALCKQMPTQICIFEDNYYSRLLPLAYFRPVYNLKCGIFSLREKIQRSYRNISVTLHCRKYLADTMRLQNPKTKVNEFSSKEYLFINGRVIADEKFIKAVPLKGVANTVYVNGLHVVAARVSGKMVTRWNNSLPEVFSISDFEGMARIEVDVKMVNYPWELVNNNGAQLRVDWTFLSKSIKGNKIKGTISAGVHLINKKDIFVGDGSAVKPGVVIDAEGGPVYIGKNVTVLPQTTIIGPVYIGDGSIVKAGAKIYEDTTIGPMCKIGGEVEASIIQGYSNKQHDGFLGHSYLGEWVNLGAGTTNSDLKNNYSSVKVIINGELINSGSQFVGATIGDHTKTAINSVFNTGTVVGVGCNVFGRGVPPQFVPSFSWGASGETFTTYDLARALEAAKRVVSRRAITLSETDSALFKNVFELTHGERRHHGTPKT